MRPSLFAVLFSLLSAISAAPVFAASPAHQNDHAHTHDGHSHEHGHSHDHAHGMANADAHVHGEVLLQLVQEDQDLVVEMTSPAVNFLGFEHEAQSQAELAAVKTMEQRLKDVTAWFHLRDGGCKADSPEVVLRQAEGHADVTFTAHFSCAAPTQLNSVELALFALFPAIEKIRFDWAVAGEQGHALLTPRNTRASFRP